MNNNYKDPIESLIIEAKKGGNKYLAFAMQHYLFNRELKQKQEIQKLKKEIKAEIKRELKAELKMELKAELLPEINISNENTISQAVNNAIKSIGGK